MNIILTNDDGYQSCGLQLLCYELSQRGHNVYVVAPDGQRSGSSHTMHYNTEIKLLPLSDFFGAKAAYSCSGSPADCVRIALRHLGVEFDLLVAGPNNAANLGRATLCSGTVGAAEEGTLCGIKSIALSRLDHCDRFESAVGFLADNLQALTESIESGFFLNINVPNLSAEQIKGVRVCSQSTVLPLFDDYCEVVDEQTLKIVGKRQPLTDEYSDVVLATSGYVTVTPMSVNKTDTAQLTKLKTLEK